MGYIQEMGADSKVFFRGTTRIPVGVCLGTSNVQQFNEDYDRFFERGFQAFGIEKPKSVFNSVDLNSIFQDDTLGYIRFLESFAEDVCSSAHVMVNVSYTMVNAKKLDHERIKYYGANKTAVQTVQVMKFIDDVSQYYPYIAAWSVSSLANIFGTKIHLDDLQGEVTDSWHELKNNHHIQVYPNGDKCNRLISGADIVVRYLDEKLWYLRARIEEQNFKRILHSVNIEDPKVFYISNKYLADIAPAEKKALYMKPFYKRPMVFILKEGIMTNEREFLEKRPESMHAIQRCAISHETGYKFIDYGKDHQLMQDGDIVIYIGSRGQEQFNLLKDMGYKLTGMSLQDLRGTTIDTAKAKSDTKSTN